MLRKLGIVGGGALALLVLYLLLWPVSIDPVAWEAPEAPALEGVFAPNRALAEATRFGLTDGAGPEDVAIDAAGRILGGLHDGRIVRLDLRSGTQEIVADTGGRPLGLDFDPDGRLIVADADRGLLAIEPGGEIVPLVSAFDGEPFGFTDDVDVAPDGMIYFTDASTRYGYGRHIEDAFEHRPSGALYAYDPRTKSTERLLDDLVFANGVAVSHDGSFLLVNETWNYRVMRYWLRGPDAGTHEVLVDNLPGFPDGISTGRGGIFWIAIFAPRHALLDATASRPWLRGVLLRLPAALRPAPARYGFVLGIDASGAIVANLQDPDGGYAPITSVEQHDDALWLGSLTEPAIARLEVPPRALLADVVSVAVEGEPGALSFEVGLSSPDTGCDRYADWWELVGEDGSLIARRILTHSHVDEQPFVRRTGPVAIDRDTPVWVRAHMQPGGFGGAAMYGTARDGFVPAVPPDGFAAELESRPPLPEGCRF